MSREDDGGSNDLTGSNDSIEDNLERTMLKRFREQSNGSQLPLRDLKIFDNEPRSRLEPMRDNNDHRWIQLSDDFIRPQDRSMTVPGKLVVHGPIQTPDIPDVEAEIRHLKERIAQLETMVNELWYSPGMPGFVEARREFDDLCEQSSSFDAHAA